MISSPLGPVPLSQVASVEVTTDRYSIQHDAGQRLVIVSFNVNGASLQDVVNRAQQSISQLALAPGVFVEFTGAAEAELRTRNELVMYSALALAFIVMVLFISFHWRANSWLVLANFAVRPDRQRVGDLGHGARNFTGIRGGPGDRFRDQRPQRHPAACALRAPRRGRGSRMGPGSWSCAGPMNGWCPS